MDSDFFSDTDPKALQVFLDIHRNMPAARKVEMVFEMTEMVLAASRAGVRMLYPDANEREVFLRATARRLDRETMIRVYGWDPLDHD